MLVGLHESSWKVDSDFKEDLLERVSIALIRRLQKLEYESVTPINLVNK